MFVKFNKQVDARGRSGWFKCSGVEVSTVDDYDSGQECILINPVTSRGNISDSIVLRIPANRNEEFYNLLSVLNKAMREIIYARQEREPKKKGRPRLKTDPKKKLRGIAVCPNCNKLHFTKGVRITRTCACGYFISASNFREYSFK